MKVDTTEAERVFFSLNGGLVTFVSNVLADYEQRITLLAQELQKKNEEIKKLKEKECKDDCKS